MAVVVRGRLRQDDTPQRVLAAPVDAEVAAFVGVETRLPGHCCASGTGSAWSTSPVTRSRSSPRSLPGRQVLCCLRPEDMTLRTVGRASPAAPVTSARNLLRGVVTGLAAKGPFVHVTVDCGPTLVAAVTKVSALEMGLRAGDAVEASFKATAVHLIGLPE